MRARRDGAGHLQQLLGQEPARRQPDLGQRHAEAGSRAGDHEVAMQRQLVAAGDRIALHDGDDGQRIVLDRVQHGLDGRGAGRTRGALLHVEAGAEHRPRRADHGHALARARRLGEGRLQLGDHLGVERVALVGPVEEHAADRALHAAMSPWPCCAHSILMLVSLISSAQRLVSSAKCRPISSGVCGGHGHVHRQQLRLHLGRPWRSPPSWR